MQVHVHFAATFTVGREFEFCSAQALKATTTVAPSAVFETRTMAASASETVLPEQEDPKLLWMSLVYVRKWVLEALGGEHVLRTEEFWDWVEDESFRLEQFFLRSATEACAELGEKGCLPGWSNSLNSIKKRTHRGNTAFSTILGWPVARR